MCEHPVMCIIPGVRVSNSCKQWSDCLYFCLRFLL